MTRLRLHPEEHLVHRIGWLRAAIMGANDGIVSTASIIAGVASAGADTGAILVAGVAGLVAGAMSMAAGEYVSVSSQTDTEQADLARETKELAEQWPEEVDELTGIYEQRGLEPALARQVAEALMAKDALAVHAREELGITETTTARPVQAAVTSALTFSAGAALPLLVSWLAPRDWTVPAVAVGTLISLAVLGALGARAGGAGLVKGAARVTLWGAFALAVTAGIGALFGTVV
ncbi:MAG: VIT family protein [Candidatus Promineifilaceae bacterium]|jgi:VIT1/CCC1 family predicted Fe2+/Mn2+ transporter